MAVIDEVIPKNVMTDSDHVEQVDIATKKAEVQEI